MFLVSVLSSIELGERGQAPLGCRVGDPVTEFQAFVLSRLERFLEPWLGTATGLSSDLLGQIADKCKAVSDFYLKFLPFALHIRHAVNPYSRLNIPVPDSVRRYFKQLESRRMKAAFASRLRFTKGLCCYEPGNFVPPDSLLGYCTPSRF